MDNSDLSDDALLEGMRDEFAHVRLGASVEDVLARGRQLRRRRNWPVLGAGSGTVAAVVALAFSLATPGAASGDGTHAVLDAWSVVSKPDGTVSLTIRAQRESVPDRARLARALRQAGVPAVVQTGVPFRCLPTVKIQPGITISRHPSAVTFYFKRGKLPKGIRIAIVIPAVEVRQGSGSVRRVEVWAPPGATRRVHKLEQAASKRHGRSGRANARRLPLPQIIVLAPSTSCTTATPKAGR